MPERHIVRHIAAALTLASALTFAGNGAAIAQPAAPAPGPYIVTPDGDPLSEPTTPEEDAAIAELTPIVEKLFTQVLTRNARGAYVFDYDKTASTLGKATADQIAAKTARVSANALPDYAKCVLERAGYGGLVGLFTGAFRELIEKKLWTEVAKIIVKQVGLGAVKGGVVGLAASLTVAAGWCAFFD